MFLSKQIINTYYIAIIIITFLRNIQLIGEVNVIIKEYLQAEYYYYMYTRC